MDNLFGNLFFCAIFVAAVVFLLIIAAKKSKEHRIEADTAEEDVDTPVEEDFPTEEILATVVELSCCSKMIGIKTPKAVREFTVAFQTENGDILRFNVPEEMYDGFEEGQQGRITLVDGTFYGFELE